MLGLKGYVKIYKRGYASICGSIGDLQEVEMHRNLLAFLSLVVIVSVLSYYQYEMIYLYKINIGSKSASNENSNIEAMDYYVKAFVSIVALLCGITFGSLHRIWRDQKTPLDFSALKAALRNPELWRSLLLSPMLFSGAYLAAQQQTNMILAFIVAFQVGFFCDTVLQKSSKPD